MLVNQWGEVSTAGAIWSGLLWAMWVQTREKSDLDLNRSLHVSLVDLVGDNTALMSTPQCIIGKKKTWLLWAASSQSPCSLIPHSPRTFLAAIIISIITAGCAITYQAFCGMLSRCAVHSEGCKGSSDCGLIWCNEIKRKYEKGQGNPGGQIFYYRVMLWG